MAGETVKTTNLTATQAGTKRNARLADAKARVGRDKHAFLSTETETADVVLFDIRLQSNAIVRSVRMYNDDLDSNGSPTLVFDIGLAAGADFVKTVSDTETKILEDAILDADLFCDGDATAQAATTKFTDLALDSATAGPDDIDKPLWEKLGYDFDPQTSFVVSLTAQVAAATGAAGDLALEVEYILD